MKDAPMAQAHSPPPFPAAVIFSEEQQPVPSLPEGPLVDILSRVPYRSLCRFKCVSKPWLALCSDPHIRKRSPETLSGFFFNFLICDLSFCNLSGRGPPLVDASLPFLRKNYELVIPRHCSWGLVLCRCWKSHPRPDEWELPLDPLQFEYEDEYNLVVCNPATEKWTELPPSPMGFYDGEQYLGFNPTVPSRFVVFAHRWEQEELQLQEVAIYSSDTGRWTTVQPGLIKERILAGPWECVLLNDTMHLMTSEDSVIIVDTKGKVWRDIDIPGGVPRSYDPSIGQSQGRLYAWYINDPNVCQLSVWALEDYCSAKWTLKHTVNVLELLGRRCRKDGESYKMIAIHPERNLIFLTDGNEKTMSYDMDNQEVHVICTSKKLLGVQPYIPCFAEWPSDGH